MLTDSPPILQLAIVFPPSFRKFLLWARRRKLLTLFVCVPSSLRSSPPVCVPYLPFPLCILSRASLDCHLLFAHFVSHSRIFRFEFSCYIYLCLSQLLSMQLRLSSRLLEIGLASYLSRESSLATCSAVGKVCVPSCLVFVAPFPSTSLHACFRAICLLLFFAFVSSSPFLSFLLSFFRSARFVRPQELAGSVTSNDQSPIFIPSHVQAGITPPLYTIHINGGGARVLSFFTRAGSGVEVGVWGEQEAIDLCTLERLVSMLLFSSTVAASRRFPMTKGHRSTICCSVCQSVNLKCEAV